MRLDHVGIATDDAAALAEQYGTLLGCERVHGETFEGTRVVFLDCGNCALELLEPVDSEGAVARYLDERGPGLHHIAVETDDVEAGLSRAREAGVDLVDEEPRPGARGHTVAFLHPASTGGVLVEFVER